MTRRLVALMVSIFLCFGFAQAESWQKTYQTKWRDVAVDVEIRTPDVERIPILLVGCGVDDETDNVPEGWDELKTMPGSFRLSLERDGKDYPRTLDGKKLNANLENRQIWYEGYNAENRYVPLSDTTLGEVYEAIDDAIAAIGLDPVEYDVSHPTSISDQHMFFYGYKRDALPGGIRLHFRPKLHGLPVLGHIMEVMDDGSDSTIGEYRTFPQCQAVYSGYDEKITSLSLWRCEVIDIVADDVPVVDFDQALTVLEPEIISGRLQKVYEVTLGYLLYNEPGQYHSRKTALVEGRDSDEVIRNDKVIRDAENAAARYYAKPVWQIRALWVDNPRNQARSGLDERCLYVDAQTGELIVRSDSMDRAAFDDMSP